MPPGLGPEQRHAVTVRIGGQERGLVLQGDGPPIAGPLQPKPLQLAWRIDRQRRQRRAQMMAEAGLQSLDRKVEHNRLDVVGNRQGRTMHQAAALAKSAQQRAVPCEQKRHAAT